MARVNTLPNRATPNSAATSHHKEGGTDSWLEIAFTIPSMISFVIHKATTGTIEAISRKTSPSVTTTGPAFQTIRSTGGTFRSAARRSSNPLQKFSRLAMGSNHRQNVCPKDAKVAPEFVSGAAYGTRGGSPLVPPVTPTTVLDHVHYRFLKPTASISGQAGNRAIE